MSWLGISGLVHDLGKVEIPLEILNKPGKLSPSEFQEMEKHPLNSVSQVLKLQAPRDLKTKILLPPLEHHMKYDFSGYPRVRRKQPVSLFGRIITIADVYDALSSPRIYRPVAYSPDKVLGMLMEGAGKDFDPILVKVFINMLGIYPVGTLLNLDTGEKGLVVSCGEGENKARPLIVLLESDNQGGYEKTVKVSPMVTLGERLGAEAHQPYHHHQGCRHGQSKTIVEKTGIQEYLGQKAQAEYRPDSQRRYLLQRRMVSAVPDAPPDEPRR